MLLKVILILAPATPIIHDNKFRQSLYLDKTYYVILDETKIFQQAFFLQKLLEKHP